MNYTQIIDGEGDTWVLVSAAGLDLSLYELMDEPGVGWLCTFAQIRDKYGITSTSS